MYKKVNQCRICGNNHLEQILALGNQMLTGVFLKSNDDRSKVTVGPLSLVKCIGKDSCGLVQLEHSFDLLDSVLSINVVYIILQIGILIPLVILIFCLVLPASI